MANWKTLDSFDFSSSTGWTLGTGFAVSGGKLNVTTQSADNWAYITNAAVYGKARQRVTFTVSTTASTADRSLLFNWLTSGDSVSRFPLLTLYFFEGGDVRLYHTDQSTYSTLQTWSASTEYTIIAEYNSLTRKIYISINGTEYNNAGAGYPPRYPKVEPGYVTFGSYGNTTGKTYSIDNLTVEYDSTYDYVLSTSVKYPGSQTTIQGTYGTANCTWNNPSYILAQDTNYATVTSSYFDTNCYTYQMNTYNYGFSVPSGSIIFGVFAEISAYAAAASCQFCSYMWLLDTAGTRTGTGATYRNEYGMSTSFAESKFTFGGVADKWGCALTPSWVNNSNFGLAFNVKATALNTDVYVNFARLRVYYVTVGKSNLVSGLGIW